MQSSMQKLFRALAFTEILHSALYVKPIEFKLNNFSRKRNKGAGFYRI